MFRKMLCQGNAISVSYFRNCAGDIFFEHSFKLDHTASKLFVRAS